MAEARVVSSRDAYIEVLRMMEDACVRVSTFISSQLDFEDPDLPSWRTLQDNPERLYESMQAASVMVNAIGKHAALAHWAAAELTRVEIPLDDSLSPNTRRAYMRRIDHGRESLASMSRALEDLRMAWDPVVKTLHAAQWMGRTQNGWV